MWEIGKGALDPQCLNSAVAKSLALRPQQLLTSYLLSPIDGDITKHFRDLLDGTKERMCVDQP